MQFCRMTFHKVYTICMANYQFILEHDIFFLPSSERERMVSNYQISLPCFDHMPIFSDQNAADAPVILILPVAMRIAAANLALISNRMPVCAMCSLPVKSS